MLKKVGFEIKIEELKADIEKLQANQFEQFKKVSKRENIEIRIDDIPEILQLIKNLQQGAKIEIEEINGSDSILSDASFESTRTHYVDEDKIIRHNDLRTLDSLESLASIK